VTASDVDLDEGRDGASDDLGAAPDTRRRGIRAAVLVVPIALVLLVLIAVLATRDPATDRRVDSPLVGKAAPRISGTTLEGQEFDSSTYDGRWLVVNFFATWCVPCVKEHPELVAFEQAHGEAGDANVISVVFEDDATSVERFFDRNGGDWPVVFGQSTVIADWGVSGVPESYIVDPGGLVAAKVVGGVTAAGLDDLLADLATEPEGGG
jgi:cytochrome c biogenesis protein CcmG, thiol:disulfide interchange protein DsbE